MSNWCKLALLAAGVAGAWCAVSGDRDVPQTQGQMRERVQRAPAPAERGALLPDGWRATDVPPEDEPTRS